MTAAVVAVVAVLAILPFVKNDGEAEPPIVRWLRRLRRLRERPRAAPKADQTTILLDGLFQNGLLHPETYLAQRLAERRHRDLKRWLAVLGVGVAAAFFVASHLENTADRYTIIKHPDGNAVVIDNATGQRWRRLPNGERLEMSPVVAPTRQ